MELASIINQALDHSKKLGVEKSLVSLSSIVSKEFNIEANKFTLLRTNFDQKIKVKSIIQGKAASVSSNQFTEDSIIKTTKESFQTAMSSPSDEANGFAPNQGKHHFTYGEEEADENWIYEKLNELLQQREKKFPKIIIDASTIKFVKANSILASSEGTFLTSTQGYYEGSVMFGAKEGKKASSFNYIGFVLGPDFKKKNASLLEVGYLRELFAQTTEQIEVKKIPQKFEGEIIVTPHCLSDLVSGVLDYLGSAKMLKKSSIFQDKVGQAVASTVWDLKALPTYPNFSWNQFWTSDGYLASNETIFKKGVLQGYLLSHYAGQKLKLAPTKSEGTNLKFSAGESSLEKMISSVKKGILMCRYSAGMPAENGDVSGVAKNSYYIEDGKIQYPVGETMVAFNLAEMLKNTTEASNKTINTGYSEFPWIKFHGATVS